MLDFEVGIFAGEMYQVSHLNWELAVAIRKLQICSGFWYSKARVWKKSRKVNCTKEEEYTLVEAIQAVGYILRGTGQSAEINKKKTRLWNDVMGEVNSIHGNIRNVKVINKLNNLKGSAKSLVDSSRREARRTGSEG